MLKVAKANNRRMQKDNHRHLKNTVRKVNEEESSSESDMGFAKTLKE